MTGSLDQDFEMHSGDDISLEFTVKRDGVVVNLTGYTIQWRMARSASSAVASVSKTSVGFAGITHPEPATGKFYVFIDAADTAGLQGEFYHEAEVEDPNGLKFTVASGKATILPDLIR